MGYTGKCDILAFLHQQYGYSFWPFVYSIQRWYVKILYQNAISTFLTHFFNLIIGEFWFGTKFDAIGFSLGDSFELTFLPNLGLKLGYGCQLIEQQLAGGSRGIDILVRDDQFDPFLSQTLRDLG